MKRIFSGIQPSGALHIGNYLGAIKQFVELQNEPDTECIFCIVDLHAITVPQDPKKLREKILELAAIYLACGIDPEKSTLFIQSSRPEHSELAWIVNCHTYMGELARMTQFKEKSGQKDIYVNIAPLPIKTSDFGWILSMKAEESLQILSNTKNREKIYNNYLEVCQKIGIEPPQTKEELIADYRSQVEKKLVSVGLFDYPALMAADILLYQTTHVPVGEDQKQHIEITRDIAERMNNKYGQLFTIPEPLIKKETARIMGLDDPKNKMSKSASSPANYIALTDDPETIRQKIKRAVTDSGSEIKAGPGKPAISNLLTIFSGVTDKSIPELEKEFEGKGYGEFKDALAEAVVEFLKPIQTKFKELISDEAKLRQILAAGSEKIAPLAQRTLADVKSKVGLG